MRKGALPASSRRTRHGLGCNWPLSKLQGAIEDMSIPGFRLHALKGRERGRWSIWVNGNWRLTFELHDGNVYAVDYEDYN